MAFTSLITSPCLLLDVRRSMLPSVMWSARSQRVVTLRDNLIGNQTILTRTWRELECEREKGSVWFGVTDRMQVEEVVQRERKQATLKTGIDWSRGEKWERRREWWPERIINKRLNVLTLAWAGFDGNNNVTVHILVWPREKGLYKQTKK